MLGRSFLLGSSDKYIKLLNYRFMKTYIKNPDTIRSKLIEYGSAVNKAAGIAYKSVQDSYALLSPINDLCSDNDSKTPVLDSLSKLFHEVVTTASGFYARALELNTIAGQECAKVDFIYTRYCNGAYPVYDSLHDCIYLYNRLMFKDYPEPWVIYGYPSLVGEERDYKWDNLVDIKSLKGLWTDLSTRGLDADKRMQIHRHMDGKSWNSIQPAPSTESAEWFTYYDNFHTICSQSVTYRDHTTGEYKTKDGLMALDLTNAYVEACPFLQMNYSLTPKLNPLDIAQLIEIASYEFTGIRCPMYYEFPPGRRLDEYSVYNLAKCRPYRMSAKLEAFVNTLLQLYGVTFEIFTRMYVLRGADMELVGRLQKNYKKHKELFDYIEQLAEDKVKKQKAKKKEKKSIR